MSWKLTNQNLQQALNIQDSATIVATTKSQDNVCLIIRKFTLTNTNPNLVS